MENKQPKRRWKIPVLLVSAICILLASSFVFSIGVEALTYDYSLQTFYPQNPVDRDGSDYATVDTSVITDMSVTQSNAYTQGTMQSSSFSLPSGSYFLGYQGYVEDGYFVVNQGRSIATLVSSTRSLVYNPSTVGISSATIWFASDDLYLCTDSVNRLYVVSSDNEIVYSVTDRTVRKGFACFEYESFLYLFYYYRNGSTNEYVCDIVDVSSGQLIGTSNLLSEILSVVYDGNGKVFILLYNALGLAYFEDGNLHTDVLTIPDGMTPDYCKVFSDGTDVYLYGQKWPDKLNKLYKFDSVDTFDYVMPLGSRSNSAIYEKFATCINGNFMIQFESASYIFSSDPNFSYDIGEYISSSFIPDRWANFTLPQPTLGRFTGGYHVGLELDYGVSPTMYSQIAVKGMNITVGTLIASDNVISTETTLTCPRPLNVWNGTKYITQYSTQYNLIGQVDGKYLYCCTSTCNLSTQGRLNNIKVVINCYIPSSIVDTSWSIPVSIFSLTDEVSGGGGGESSDVSSGGGGGESSDASSGGNVSVPDDGLNHIFLVSYDENGNAYYEYVDSIDLASASSVRLYLGAYTSYGSPMQSDVPVKCNLLVSYGNSPPDEHRYDFHAYGYMIGNSFQSPSVVGAYQFPAFVGYYVDISVGAGEDLYLSEVSPWGTLFVAQNSFSFGQCLTAQLPDPNAYIHLEFTSADSVSVVVMSDSPAQRKSFPVSYDGYSLGFRENDGYFHYYPYPAEVGESLNFTVDWFVDDGQSLFACILGDYDDLKPSPLPSWSDDLSKYYDDLAEVSRKWEIMESLANENYGKYPFENDQVVGGFDDAVSLFDDIANASGGEYLVDYLKGMWTVHPYFPLMIGMVVTFAIIGFIIYKL